MTENQKNTCEVCGSMLSEDNRFVLNGEVLCEDCHMEKAHPVAICDPWPVLSAKKQMEAEKRNDVKLTDLQNAICSFIIEGKKTTLQELCEHFGLTDFKVNNELAVLRHHELVKGKKEGSNVYIVPFSS